MKPILLSLFVISLSAACNNNAMEEQVTKQEMPVQEKEMKDAIAKYPDSIPLRVNLIHYYDDNGNFDLALSETNNALKIDSNNTNLWDEKASYHIYLKDTVNAIKAYEKAITIFPDPQFIMSVGVLYAYTKNKMALDMANALLIGNKARADKEAYIIKAIYYKAINDNHNAMTVLDECIKLNYTYTPAYREKGMLLYEEGKYEEGISLLNKAVTLDNKFYEGYYWMGMCYEKQKNINAAIEQYQKAILYSENNFIEAKDALARLGVK